MQARATIPELQGPEFDALFETRYMSPDFDTVPPMVAGNVEPQPAQERPEPVVDVNTDEEGDPGAPSQSVPKVNGPPRKDPSAIHAPWETRVPAWRHPAVCVLFNMNCICHSPFASQLQPIYDKIDEVARVRKLTGHPRIRGPILPQETLPDTKNGRIDGRKDGGAPAAKKGRKNGRKGNADSSDRVLAIIPRCFVCPEWLAAHPDQTIRTVDVSADVYPDHLPQEGVARPHHNAEAGPSHRVRTPSMEPEDDPEEGVATEDDGENGMEYE